MLKKIAKVLSVSGLVIISQTISQAAGTCTLSDNCISATPFTFCSPVSASNSGCTTDTKCDASDDTDAGPFSTLDECDIAWAAAGSSCTGSFPQTYTSPSNECSCIITGCMGPTIVYSQSDHFCGSIDNSSYTKVCIPSDYVSIGSCLWSYSITDIACNGGGASLQWAIFPSAGTCANLTANYPNGTGALYCTNGSLADWSASYDASPDSCYLIMFDGNAKAACDWTFNIIPPMPKASINDDDEDNVICPGTCINFTNSGDCYTNSTWTNNAGKPNGTGNTYSVCFPDTGTFTVTLTNSVVAGACSSSSYSVSSTQTYTVNDCCIGITVVSQTNVLCNGGNTGSLDIDIKGGPSPFTYSWSNGELTQDITGLTAGTYKVTVIGSTNCTFSKSFTITQPPAIKPSAIITVPSFPIACDGAINLEVTGGVAPYTYLWNGGSNSQDQINLCMVNHSVTITDANGCTSDTTFYMNTGIGSDNFSTNNRDFQIINRSGDLIISINNPPKFFPVKFELYKLDGRKIFSYEVASSGTFTIPLSKFNSGIYIVRIYNSDQNRFMKVFKD